MREDARTAPVGGDAVDRIIGQWLRERPDLDPTAKAVTGRIVRLASLIQRRFAEVFSDLGLGEGDYGLLAALRRSGEPFQLTPTQLARAQMMTSGGMTAVIDRLERQSLVRRVPNPDDRRGSLVRLSAKGRRTIDEAMALHATVEHELVSGLTKREREQLGGLLRALLVSLDDDRP